MGVNTAIIIQARMGSTRLPGKVLLSVRGKSLIQYLLVRVRAANLGLPIIVATSRDSSDDPIASFCDLQALDCYRGSYLDVASRFADVIDIYGLDAFVRLSGDSPLLDGSILRQAMGMMADSTDLVTNIYPRSYPRGQSVEILKAECFRKAFPRMKKDSDREHVTSFFYRNAAEFKIQNLLNTPSLPFTSMAVDTKEDFDRFKRLIEAVGDAWIGMTYQQLLERMQKGVSQQDLLT